MRNSLEQAKMRRAAIAAIVAVLFVGQSALAAFADCPIGAKAGLFSQICASALSGAPDDSTKKAPHDGSCCILQHNVWTEADFDAIPVVIPARDAETAGPSLRYRAAAVADPPELASAAPRGPPPSIA